MPDRAGTTFMRMADGWWCAHPWAGTRLMRTRRGWFREFASAVDVICQASRLTGGPRKIISFTEVLGMEGDVVTMQEIMTFEQQGIGPDGKAFGRFIMTGVRPSFLDRLRAHGADIDRLNFERRVLSSGPEALARWRNQ